MRKRVMLASLMLAAVALTGCGSDEDVALIPEEPPVEEPKTPESAEEPTEEPVVAHIVELTAAQKTAVQKNNEFAFNFFRAINESPEFKGKSNLVSPLSLTYVLGMVNAGATGQTSQEITSLLGFGADDKEAVNELCKRLINNAPIVDKAVSLTLANCVAVDKPVILMEQYRQTMTDCYDAELASLDFDTNEAVDYLNNWCRERTQGMIPQIVDRLDGVMALMNAVYFKGPWSNEFDPAETKDDTFTREDGSEVLLPMMQSDKASFYSHPNDTYATLGMAYGQVGNWVMYLLLPNEGKTVDDIVNGLTVESWNENVGWRDISAKISVGVDVKIPRFKVESNVNLGNIIAGMGAPSMFVARGEFPLVSENYKDLAVSLIKQKAAIEVSEEGTEASAVTIAYWSGANDKSGYTPIPEFHATRPFIYLIQERTTGAIFFMGTYRGV